MSAETKKRYAARIRRGNVRSQKPARKRMRFNPKRDLPALRAYQTAAVDILDALFGTKRP